MEKEKPEGRIELGDRVEQSQKRLEIQQPKQAPVSTNIPLGEKIKSLVSSFFRAKRSLGQSTEDLATADAELIAREVENMEMVATVEGVDFSRIQIDKVLEDRKSGKRIEFETFSPYLCDYNMSTGEIWEDKLIPADAIGLKLAGIFRKMFPKARLISLYDEYNSSMPYSENEMTTASVYKGEAGKRLLGEEAYEKSNTLLEWKLKGAPYKGDLVPQLQFEEKTKNKFKAEVQRMLVRSGGISEQSIDGKDFLLISESSKQKDAETLVEKLEAAGFIERNGEEIFFINAEAENPLYREIQLRTANGRWLCEALDASSYIKSENLEITHIVVLPESFKEQQNKVWEMLRCLGIEPLNYHNIFYDDTKKPEEVARVIQEEFAKHEGN